MRFTSELVGTLLLAGSCNQLHKSHFRVKNLGDGRAWSAIDSGGGGRLTLPVGRYEVKGDTGCGWNGDSVVDLREGEVTRLDNTSCCASTFTYMIEIPSGCFDMGSLSGDEDEAPVHRVCIAPFRMDATEVTQGAYRVRALNNPSYFGLCGADCPVERVSWSDAQSYCESLGKRLPTEAEWEYAARGGTTTKWYWGDEADSIGDYAWYAGNSLGRTHPVGRKKPNAWGLYDMAGNVWEWTADWYARYQPGPQTDSGDSSKVRNRVDRGGSWFNIPTLLRSSFRGLDMPGYRNSYLGFRCAQDSGTLVPRQQAELSGAVEH